MDGEEERRVEESEMDGAGSSTDKRGRGRPPGSRNQTDRSRLDSTTKRKDRVEEGKMEEEEVMLTLQWQNIR